MGSWFDFGIQDRVTWAAIEWGAAVGIILAAGIWRAVKIRRAGGR